MWMGRRVRFQAVANAAPRSRVEPRGQDGPSKMRWNVVVVAQLGIHRGAMGAAFNWAFIAARTSSGRGIARWTPWGAARTLERSLSVASHIQDKISKIRLLAECARRRLLVAPQELRGDSRQLRQLLDSAPHLYDCCASALAPSSGGWALSSCQVIRDVRFPSRSDAGARFARDCPWPRSCPRRLLKRARARQTCV